MAKVVISLELDANNAVTGFTTVGTGAKKAGEETAKAEEKVKGFFESVKEGAAMGAGIAIFDKLTGAVSGFGSMLANVAVKAAGGGGGLMDIMQKTGLGAKGLSGELALAAAQSSSSVEGIASATGVLQKSIAENSKGIKALGLDVEVLKNLKPEEALRQTAAAILAIKNPNEQAAASMAVFKKSGTELLPVFKAVAGGAAEMAEAIHAGLSDEEVGSLDTLDDSLTTVGLSWERFQQHAVAAINQSGLLSGAVEGVAKGIGELSAWIEDNSAKIGELAGEVKSLASDGMEYLGNAATGAASGISVLWTALSDASGLTAIKAIDDALGGMLATLGKVAAKGAAMAALGPVGMIVDGLAGAGAAKKQYDFENYNTKGTKEQVDALNGVTAPSTKVDDNTKNIEQLEAESDARLEAKAKQDEKDQAAADKAAAAAAAKKAKQLADEAAMSKHNYDLGVKQAKEFNAEIFRVADDKSQKIIQGFLEEQQAADAAAEAEYQATVEWNQKTAEYEERLRQEREQKRKDDIAKQVDGARMLAGLLADVGAEAGGAFGTIATLGAGALDVFANLNDEALKSASTLQKVGMAAQGAVAAYKSGSVLGGAASGAASGAAFGPWGAAIGGVVGGVLGFFGGKSKKKAEEAAAKKKALEEGTAELEGLVEKYRALKKEFSAEGAGKDGLGAMFDNFAKSAKGSQAQLDRLSRMGAVSLESLRKAGYTTSEAFEIMGDTIDSAIEAAKKHGLKLSGPLAAMADFRGKVKKNQEAVDAGEGLGTYLKGARATGSLDQAGIDDASAQLKDLNEQYQKAGFTADQISTLLAPALFEIKQMADAGKVSIDAETDALIKTAAAGGAFDGMTDPMDEMLKIMSAMLETTAALTKALGGELPANVQKLIDELNQIPTDIGVDVNVNTTYTGGAPPAGTGSAPTPGKYNPDVTAAAGFGPKKLTQDTTFLAHKGEHVLIVPAGHQFKSASLGFGQSYGIARGEHVPGSGWPTMPSPTSPSAPAEYGRIAEMLSRASRTGSGTASKSPRQIVVPIDLRGASGVDLALVTKAARAGVTAGLRERTDAPLRTAVRKAGKGRNA